MYDEKTLTTPLPIARPIEYVVQEHHTYICGLSKQEYIALELTKAWTSTRCNGHEETNEILDVYEYMLKEVNTRIK